MWTDLGEKTYLRIEMEYFRISKKKLVVRHYMYLVLCAIECSPKDKLRQARSQPSGGGGSELG